MLIHKKVPPEIQLIMVQAMIGAAFVCVFAYISLWGIFCVWSDATHTYPILFRVNACIFIFEVLAIYQFMQYCKKERYKSLLTKQKAVTIYYILSGLHWSIITTYLIYSGMLSIDQQYAMRLISVGFAGIMGSLLGIANLTGLAFTVAIILPHIIASYWFQDPHAHFLTLLSFVFWLFLYTCTRSIQKNCYLQFISNFRLTQVHADSMEHLSKKDIITKLNNRFHWLVNFESLWTTSLHKYEPICLIGIKVNHLAEINEAHGRHAGDALMATVASLLQQAVEEPDCLGRYGGDLFMLTLPNLEYDQACQLADHLVHSIEEKLFIPDQLCAPILLTTSVACCKQEAEHSAASMVASVTQNLAA